MAFHDANCNYWLSHDPDENRVRADLFYVKGLFKP